MSNLGAKTISLVFSGTNVKHKSLLVFSARVRRDLIPKIEVLSRDVLSATPKLDTLIWPRYNVTLCYKIPTPWLWLIIWSFFGLTFNRSNDSSDAMI